MGHRLLILAAFLLAGATTREWWNTLCETDDDGYALYDDDELRCIADDPKESHPKRLAAKEILQAYMHFFRNETVRPAGIERDQHPWNRWA